MNPLYENQDDEFDYTQFKFWLGLLGNVFAIFFFIAPISLMIKLNKKQIDPLKVPYLIMIMNVTNCFLWFSYGILKENNKFFIELANGIGYPINLVYLVLYWFYRCEKKFINSLMFILPSIIFSGALFALLTFVIKSQDLSKYSAMVFNIFMYGAPGQNIIQVFKTGDSSLIALPSTILGFFCSLTWLGFGIYINDISVIIPNGLGLLFSIINVGTYLFFYKKTKNQDPLIENSDKITPP